LDIGFSQSREGAKEGAKKRFLQKNPPKSTIPPNRYPAGNIEVTPQAAIGHQPSANNPCVSREAAEPQRKAQRNLFFQKNPQESTTPPNG